MANVEMKRKVIFYVVKSGFFIGTNYSGEDVCGEDVYCRKSET